jgi:hypothetical protein
MIGQKDTDMRIFARTRARRPGLAGGVLVVLTALAAAAASGIPAAFAVQAAPASSTANLYAAPGASGTACSRAKPCPAAVAVKEAAKDAKFFNLRVVVHLARGTYHTTLNADYLPPSDAKSITIEGASRGPTVVNAGAAGSVLSVGADTPPVTVIGLELTKGAAPSSTGIGGGVNAGGGDVTIIDCTITDNTAHDGGGIGDSGGKVVVRSSTITGNTAAYTGGGISDTGGSVTVADSDISGNSVSGGLGGGIYEEDASLTVRNSTITGNLAAQTLPGSGSGGGIALDSSSGPVTATVLGSTLADNQAIVSGGGVWSDGSTFRFGADILTVNQAPTAAECASSDGTYVDLGYNVLDSGLCPHGGSTKVVTASAIGVQPVARNGGPTLTARISGASAAHDVVPVGARLAGAVFCSGTDQRGVPRRQGPATHCDAGAYQFAPPHIVRISPARGAPGTKVTITGYGFDFISLRFGAARPRSSINSGQTAITVRVPAHGPATVPIVLANLDGSASRNFKITG